MITITKDGAVHFDACDIRAAYRMYTHDFVFLSGSDDEFGRALCATRNTDPIWGWDWRFEWFYNSRPVQDIDQRIADAALRDAQWSSIYSPL